MSKFTKIAVALTLAGTVIASSVSAADAGKRNNNARNIGLGVFGAIVGAAIVNDRYNRAPRHRRYARDCWFEHEEVWSNRRGRYVIRKVRVCN